MRQSLVFFTTFESPLPPDVYKEKLSCLSTEDAQRIMRFRRWQDAHASLYARLLLEYGCKCVSIPVSLKNLSVNSLGKPYVKNLKYAFNFSHSMNFVACIISNESDNVGIDVEMVRDIDFTDFKSIWTECEWTGILEFGSDFFFDLWTKKEAVVKALGTGISVLKEVKILGNDAYCNGQHIYLQKIDCDPPARIHIASCDPFQNISSRFIDKDILLQGK